MKQTIRLYKIACDNNNNSPINANIDAFVFRYPSKLYKTEDPID
jgi:uncharacterized protein (UPF0333 family)